MTRDAEHTPSPRSVVVPDPLWMMHVIGPDDIYPAPDHATAVQWCAYLNSEIAPKVPSVLCVAVPAIWTGTAEEHAEGLAEAIKGWTVPAAPAPSSLAGGEVKTLRTLFDNLVIAQGLSKEIRTHATDEARAYLYDTRLSALSPEAPEGDGVDLHAIAKDAAERVHKNGGCVPQMAYAPILFALQDALTPHHEAPADPCASHRSMGFHIDPCCPHCEAPAEGAGEDFITTQSLNDAASDPEWCAKWNREPSGEWSEGPTMTVTLVRHQVSGLLSIQKWDGGDDFEPGTHVLVPLCLAQRAAIRARSSAQEAREGEAVERKADGLAHLVAAISLLKRAEEIGKKPSMATGSKKMFDQMLRDYEGAANRMRKAIYTHPAREEALGNLLAVIHGDGGHRALEVGTKQAALEAEKIVSGLFAAPSADKLRIAIEALERIKAVRVCRESANIWTGADACRKIADQALATLKAKAK